MVPALLHASTTLVLLQEPRLWQRAEWRIEGGPVTPNNFDPDLIRIDAVFTTPSRRVLTVPAFWYQNYTRALVDGAQVLAPAGAPEWRLRFTPDETGEYTLALSVTQPGQATPPAVVSKFAISREAAGAAATPRGWVRTAADRRYLETSEGRPLRLIGANVCWGGARGTYDFDQWFPRMRDAGENFARLWFSPWSMGLEHKPGTLNRYDLAEAWHADYVLELAEKCGLYVLIAMDHHGMFMSNDPAWGGSNNFWTRSSPYAVENGGPCANPNEFFTDEGARKIYQKRLRYLIGRYGYSQQVLSWQFFNEIDNSYRPRAALVGDDVVAWHRAMGQWLRANDPYRHLVSTSLTGASDRPEFWAMPEMDFAVYHSYGEADPARYVAKLSADFARRYQKPVMIGEIGTSHLNWNIANDPYLRGFRQGLWGGTLGGSMGTSMSWWWEGIHDDNAYSAYTVLRDVMQRAGWNEGAWAPATFLENGSAPVTLDEAIQDGEPFTAQLPLNQLRLNPVSGEAAIADPLAAARAAERISSYLHGTRNPHLQQHARFAAWFAGRAKLVFRVNSVAADAELIVRVDEAEKLRVTLANKDGLAALNDEINQEFSVDLPAGKHRVEIAHTGSDWVNLKAVRLERVLPAAFAGGWQFATEAIGLRREDTVVVYVRSPHVAWPAGALRFNPPAVRAATVTLTGWNTGAARVVWLDPKSGREIATTRAVASGDKLPLVVPEFTEDVVGIVTR
ncbi:MAG TPA: cellulase family glycosylhydrolase [Opitutaceae bacterium]|nr:cellulase family glycosylhydrolase [Opitutaceae bacterium]